MYRLLIVDDEQDIADSLFELFRDFDAFDLDVYKAYSGIEAMDWMRKTKVDIVLTDIRMPGMSGLQLMEEIRACWPECHIIFLTGYQEFDYVYTAINHDRVRYLLKMEGREQILQAVRSTVDQINEDRRIGHLLAHAANELSPSLPFLRHAHLLDVLLGGSGSTAEADQPGDPFERLRIPLDARSPVLLIACKASASSMESSRLVRAQLVYSVHNVFEKYLRHTVSSVPVEFEPYHIVWLAQPDPVQASDEVQARFSSEWTLSSIRGNLETIQEVCYESLGVSLSIVMDAKFAEWSALPAQFQAMRGELQGWSDREIALKRVGDDPKEDDDAANEDESIMQALPRKLRQLEHELDAGQAEPFYESLQPVLLYLRGKEAKDHRLACEVYYSVALLYLSYINRKSLSHKLPPHMDLGRLLRADAHPAWTEAADYLAELAAHLFALRNDEQQDRTNAAIQKVQQYIMNHLGDEISLIRLAEIVHFNPSYLSRLFKQITGDNLSSYINGRRLDKAKELLADRKYKIHEIAVQLGFATAPYFTRFFKKQTGMSPQEYRDSRQD